eukprot:935834-Prymnesium_polylepis.1
MPPPATPPAGTDRPTAAPESGGQEGASGGQGSRGARSSSAAVEEILGRAGGAFASINDLAHDL